MVQTRLPLLLPLDRPRSETDGTDEFYFTEVLGDGLEGELRNVCLKAPNAGNTDDGEIGIYRMRQYWPLDFSTAVGARDSMRIGGRIPIYGGERVYAKITGTAVDGDVVLNAIGYAWPALPEIRGEPRSP